MTGKENYLHFLRNEPYEFIPSVWDDQLSFYPEMISENVARGMIFQQQPLDPSRYGGVGWFGIEWDYIPTVGGSMEKPGFTLLEDFEDWESVIRFPDLAALDWNRCYAENRDYLNCPDKLITTSIFTGYFERLISFAGFENAAMALIDEDQQDAVHALFDRLTEFYSDFVRRMHRFCGVENFEVHDDWGNQRSLMLSVDTHSEMILPHVRDLMDAIHAEGCYSEMHSCGKIEALVPNLIATGADTWLGQRINDKYGLVLRYGDQFKFMVEFFTDTPVTDEQCAAMTDEFIRQYSGKRILFFAGRGFTPEQQRYASERIRRECAPSSV